MIARAIMCTLLLASVFSVGCGRNVTEVYEAKVQDGYVDRDVRIESMTRKNKTAVRIVFSHKEIPHTVDIQGAANSYAAKVQVGGVLERGKAILSVQHAADESPMYHQILGPGDIQSVIELPLYGTGHIIRLLLEFEDAKNGDLTIDVNILTT